MSKLDLEKVEGSKIKLPTSSGSSKKQEFQKNIYFIDYTKASDYVDHNTLWNIFKEMGIPETSLPASREICMQVKKQQSEPDMEQRTGSKLEKEYIKAMYSHPAYVTYMHSKSCKLRLTGEMSITSHMQMTLPVWQKAQKT